MYIKKVIIEGFKSYKEEVSTDPFSPKINCVVGANGSGKTNFFHAIRFVLSDLFQNLRSEDRQALLHEGAGHQVMSAFVEIVFDNSDNRIPVDKEEVRLRRTIGVKKDEYFLDGKHVTKTEVMNLLESAGFSRSNPYYVVQQGKIASLTLMKDSERLDLLKEIGGTRVYEERRRESLKIMQETGNKRKQIDQVVQYLEERLRELDEEKEELKKYQQLDKKIRSLEYIILEKEMDDAAQKLKEIEDSRNKVSEKSTSMHNKIIKNHDKLKELEKDYKAYTKAIQGLNKDKEVIEKRRTEALKVRTQLELDLKDIEERISGDIRAKEKKLREEIQQLMDEEHRIDTYIEERRAESKRQELGISKIQEEFNRLRIQRDELQEKRKSLWKVEGELSSEIDKFRSDLVKAKKSLEHATPGDTRRGLNSVDRIVSHHNIEGVYGSILELIECDEKFFTAVEVTAGNSLFHVVVATDEISTRIIRYLTSEKGGRVTFIPLNRVNVQHVNYPQSSDVVPLLKKLKFRSDCSPAFQQVFARTVICRDLDVATNVARANALDCITLEDKEITGLVSQQQRIDAERGHTKSELDQLKLDIANALKQKQSISRALEKKEKLLGNAYTQVEQIRAGIAMKRAEMGTDLVDQLTPKEKDLLSRLNPEITELKEKLLACKTSRIEIETRKEELEANLFDKSCETTARIGGDNFFCRFWYKKKTMKELTKLLHKCNEELKQFSHVNKKALDQYMNFTEQREQLQKRRAELDAGDQKIRELISVLDQRKDESIERTFKGVARNFREVFSELVQGGHGYLVMMKKKEGEPADDDNDDDGPRDADPEGRVEKYIGVKVKVSFTGQGETQSMKQLSGGQKTVVALTLIFAIQRCDPAPFYLFDEIDAALDPQYRTAVGNMIRRLADVANTQFITTTFRPELVKVADKIYGVTHKNRVSHVHVVSRRRLLILSNMTRPTVLKSGAVCSHGGSEEKKLR
ncbi:hypothetical protein HPP92_021489 [Vanilla planifolia]|uniref:SMC hinge domain-containing protein n=1 Tax=Vanilla planifolia TaxID=51239 RepID=A0A835Q173_VANPL|nr:hypothetical protein HPP92_021489 [Vanilla planifolia]